MATSDGKKTGGRAKGVTNKDLLPIRDAFKKLIESNIEQLSSDLAALKPAERVRAITELSKFCVPTLKAVDITDTTPKDAPPKRIIFERRD